VVKEAAISIRVEAKVKRALEKAAEADGRSLSQYVERLIAIHLKERKILK
jgi:predicted HicB family RNase H-like nuclease